MLGRVSGATGQLGLALAILLALASPSAAETLYTSASVNCRAKPTLRAPVIGKVRRSSKLEALEERGTWWRVDGRPADCWIHSKYLQPSAPPLISPEMAAIADAQTVSRPARQSFAGEGRSIGSDSTKRSSSARSSSTKRRRARSSFSKPRFETDGGCPCSGYNVCVGPRGGRYCITSGGNKRYGV